MGAHLGALDARRAGAPWKASTPFHLATNESRNVTADCELAQYFGPAPRILATHWLRLDRQPNIWGGPSHG